MPDTNLFSRPRPALPKSILKFCNVSAGPRNGQIPLIRDVDLDVREGEIVGIRGRNGVGKTTLVRLVAGISQPGAGTLFFKGEPFSEVDWPGLHGGVAYLPQEPELAGPLYIGLAAKGGFEPSEQEFRTWAGTVGVAWSADASQYWASSAGERALRVLAYLAAHRPAIWILDEPTARIDERRILRLLDALFRDQPTAAMILITHSETLLGWCDRSLELTPGGLVTQVKLTACSDATT
jgi:ABC-type cobalamin/Fe3+-siderophores transport system ATPase subunit